MFDVRIFVEPSRKYADIIVLEGGRNLVALDMIMQRIENHIATTDLLMQSTEY